MQLEKFVWTGVAIGAALCIGTAPIAAKPGGAKPPTTPKMTTKVSSPKPTTHGSPKIAAQTSKTPVSGPKTTHAQAPKVKSTPGQAGMHGGKAASTTTTKTHGNPHTTASDTTTTTTGGTTTTMGGTTTETAPLTKSQQLLTRNTNLQNKLTTRLGTQLPAGVTVIDAASGFKNLGQFVAAVNVSNNLGIPFADLKAKMTGMTVDGKPITTTTGGTTTTAPTTMSLGQAIQSLKGMDSTTATETANTATTQANAEISSTTTNPKKTHH
jgi:hypothetical protein